MRASQALPEPHSKVDGLSLSPSENLHIGLTCRLNR